MTTARNRRTLSSLASFAFGVLALTGCSSSADKAPAQAAEGPGSTVVSDIIACKADTDCKSGEACSQNFCQMKRCASPQYSSTAPLGKFGYAFVDRAFVVSQADTNMQIFSPYAKGGTQLGADAVPTDITGGNLLGTRPEPIAFVSVGSEDITILPAGGGVPQHLALGFQANRIAAGDVDGDGIDEIVAVGAKQYAVCNATSKQCRRGTLGTPADDVALGDVNGDGNAEILFIGSHTLTIIDVTKNKIDTQPVPPALVNITAGDLDGDGKAEVIGTEAGGSFSSDKLHVFHVSGVLSEDAVMSLAYGGATALDVAYGKQDNKPVVAVLSDSGTLRTFSYGKNALSAGSSAVIENYAGRRIAASDLNGRSASVHIKGEPTLVVGPPVPIAVLTLPPYSGQHSSGPSSVTMGTSTDNGTTLSHGTSTSTSASLMLGTGIALPAPLSASLTVFVTNSWGHTTTHSADQGTTLSVGGSYSLSADPTADGYNSGGVVLAGGCFHQYEYTVDDPAKVLDATEKTLTMFAPVGGETTLWSTARYNALVDALGNGSLPKVNIAPKLGDVSSYPNTPTTLDGDPIPDNDNVFSQPPISRTSDVGSVGFSLSSGTSKSNTDANSFNFGTSVAEFGSVNLSIIHVQTQATQDTSYTVDESYSVSVSTSASFSGDVPAVRDDPSTPANEASLYGYSFTPYLYRHHYKNAAGKEGAFYALTYTTGD